MIDGFWLTVPLAASALLTLCLVPLGNRVLARGMVFADLAIAQWAALGSLAGMAWMPAHILTDLPVGSLLLALLAVALVHLVLQLAPGYREALIGTLYVLGASLATLLVSHDPHGAQRLAQTLNGDLLWVTPDDLPALAVVAGAVLLWHIALTERLQTRLFLPLFAVSVTLTVEMAGIYVVFATLIASPLALCHLRGHGVKAAIVVGVVGHGLGLGLSAQLDLPAGPAVVVSVILVCLLALLCLIRPAPALPFASPASRTTSNRKSSRKVQQI